MSKSNKGATPSKSQAPETGIIVKAFPSGIEAGMALGAAAEAYLQVAHRMRVTIGAAYNKATGFPQWGRLESALTEAGAKVAKSDIAKGLASKFDAMYLAAAPTSTDKAKVEKTAALFKAVGYSAFDFTCLTPQAKAALGKGNDAKAKAVQDCSDMLNKFSSAAWAGMMSADNKYHGRVTRKGSDDRKPVADIIKGCKLGDVPARVGKLVTDGVDVPEAYRQLAALIVKLKLANIKN